MKTAEFGLSANTLAALRSCFQRYPTVEKVIVYGSRAKGNFRYNSDIDLTIVGALSFPEMMRLENDLDDLLLPYTIDLSLLKNIGNPALTAHIAEAGKLLYDCSLHALALPGGAINLRTSARWINQFPGLSFQRRQKINGLRFVVNRVQNQ